MEPSDRQREGDLQQIEWTNWVGFNPLIEWQRAKRCALSPPPTLSLLFRCVDWRRRHMGPRLRRVVDTGELIYTRQARERIPRSRAESPVMAECVYYGKVAGGYAFAMADRQRYSRGSIRLMEISCTCRRGGPERSHLNFEQSRYPQPVWLPFSKRPAGVLNCKSTRPYSRLSRVL
ncbi:unnamed protein product, partial [Iphiclides podalirius]